MKHPFNLGHRFFKVLHKSFFKQKGRWTINLDLLVNDKIAIIFSKMY